MTVTFVAQSQPNIHTTPEKFENGGFTLKTYQMFSAHTTIEIFENGVFTLKMHQIFSVHTTPEEFENATVQSPPGNFGFAFDQNTGWEMDWLS